MKSQQPITIYEYPKCSTCKDALRYLDKRYAEYKKIDISQNPPTKSDLKKMIGFYDGNFRKLFNTSGIQYRELNLSSKIEKMPLEEALDLLSQNGKLVKRPFLLTPDAGRVGFKEAEWDKLKLSSNA